eukprot:COSAG01_NODE_176_length_22957_cov_72.262096_14_plen_78_part_00
MPVAGCIPAGALGAGDAVSTCQPLFCGPLPSTPRRLRPDWSMGARMHKGTFGSGGAAGVRWVFLGLAACCCCFLLSC